MQVKAIPFLAFDAGGVLELFDHELYDDVVVRDTTPDALADKLERVLKQGSLTTVQLTKDMTSGQRKWLDFHNNFVETVEANKKVHLPSSANTSAHRLQNQMWARCRGVGW